MIGPIAFVKCPLLRRRRLVRCLGWAESRVSRQTARLVERAAIVRVKAALPGRVRFSLTGRFRSLDHHVGGFSEASGVGIINFVAQGDRVRFGIDEAEAAVDGLTISSRLLSLATYVRKKP